MLIWKVIKHGNTEFFIELPHLLYYDFAQRELVAYQNHLDAIEQSRRKKDHDRNLWYDYRLRMNNVLVYSAFTLEAFINYYGSVYDIIFREDLDRSLSTANKWKIYPKLKTNKTIDGSALKTIKRIFSLRDDIVHAKPERIVRSSEVEPKGKSAQAKLEKEDLGQILIDLNEVFLELFKIDEDEAKAHDKNPWMFLIKKC